MKKFFFLLIIYVLAILPQLKAQVQLDNLKTKKEDVLPKMRLDTLIRIPNAKPIFRKDTGGFENKEKSAPVLKGGEATGSMMMATTEDVGKTPVYIDVSPSGAAIASIPINIPKGINGFTPEVSLVYNSQGGNGVAGYGWGIGGLSSISRIPATKFHNSRIGGINLDMNDFFALDGQRLLLKTGTYGHPNAEYQTENYANLRIFSRGSVPIGSNTGPDYFEVWYPDGSKAFYGATNSSKTVIEYGVTYRESNLGARINYAYASTNNTLKLLQINYGTLGTGQGINTINFSYETAQRSEQAYVAGQNIYRDFILNKISVGVNGTSLRHYNVETNAMNLIGYQRLDGLLETNGDETKSLGRIYFSYEISSDITYSSTVSNLSLSQIASNNSDAVFGDFTGSGTMDFILRPTAKNKFWTFFDLEPGSAYMQFGYEVNTGYYKEVFPIKWLTQNSKLLSGDGFAVVKDLYGSYKFDILSRGTTAPVYFQYDRLWNAPRAWGYYSECDNLHHDGPILNQEFISGDFNGDGLTDIIAINRPYYNLVTYERLEEGNPWDPDPPVTPLVSLRPPPVGNCVQEYGNMDYSQVHLINLDRRITTNFAANIGYLNKSYTVGDKLYTGDFNGDGKTDIIHVANGIMYVYGLNDNNYLQLLWQENDTRISLNEEILLGDYNGDGKTDLMFSTTTSFQYALFMSKGNGFKKHTQMLPWPFGKGSKNQYYYQGQWHQNSTTLLPIDINGDGKTDFAQVYSETTDNSFTGTIKLRRTRNMGYSEANGITFSYDINADEDSRQTNIRHNPIPVALTLDRENFNLELGFLSDNTLSLYRLGANMQVAKRLDGVWNKGETHDVAYKPLLSGYDYNSDIPIYETSYGQTYPNVEFENIPNLSVVSKITRAYYNTNHLQQIFGYANAVSNTEGLGFLGFGKIIRSNWHVDAWDNNKMFDVTISDPALRGATTNSFKVKYPYINPSILSAPLASDGATINDYITRTALSYQTQTLSNKVFVNAVLSSASKDLLTGVTGQSTNEYDSYYNVTKTTSNVNNLATKVEEATYDNNPSGYYIGRPLTRKTTMSAAGDTHSTEEEFTYTGYLPTQIKKKGHGTPWITENLNYDTFGNVIQKSITTASGTRTTSATYDATGRFPISQTDVEGLTSTANYDATTGDLMDSFNGYGQLTTAHVYDFWGRATETVDYYGKKTYNSYTTSPNGYIFAQTDDEGREKTTYTNHLGQTTQSTEKTITGSIVGTATEYDVYGRAYRQSQPAAPGSYNQWNETEFDEYGRVKKTSTYTGKVTNISYNGLSTTVNDGTKSVTTTKNALGQTISVQDPGGTINYTYYAHGGLKTTDYQGSTQMLEYDGWGRKTKLTDPSAGQYTYTYNAFGEITQETTPKGTTNYTYDAATGKLTGKTLVGVHTNLGYAYSYNNSTKLLNSLSFTNADGNNATYTYTYDTDYRLTSTVEDNLHAQFTKTYTYDAFGRIATEGYEAKDKASNTTATRTVAYTYQNGEILQAVDQATGQILSKVNTLKPNGQLATELQGNNLKTTYNYDSYNLPQSTVTQRIGTNPATLMNLGYSFDALRGNLNSRSNSALSWSETFSYDNLDRLTNFNDNNGNSTQSYDARGRIINNSALGNYGYSDAVSYQQTELTSPTPIATAWYQDRALQQMSFNAFKKPVNINEQGKEQIDFLYSVALQRSTMYYGSDDADKESRPMRRHYSEDGGMEITRNIVTGETSFTFYLSGDAYDAPAMYKEVHTSSSTSASIYYLHRDHLGSIVLITDVDGNAVEKRQFDAWGNIVALTDGNGNPLTAFLITDRGYTGHEHLLGVGLINMNGRLYDPMLHRFVSPDNNVQDPFNTQNFNRYGYVMNNPFMYTDPSGEILIPILIGALIGAYTGGTMANNGELNPLKWDYSSGKTWGYMLGGAIVGGASGWAGGAIATSGMPFANTAGIASASFINSVGTNIYTGGKTDISINFGFGSYNFSTGEFGFLGKKGNSLLENIGYSLGALANVQDAFAGIKGGTINVKARKKLAGHSWIEGEDINISVGPGVDSKQHLDGIKWESQYLFKTVKGENFVTQYIPENTFSTTLNNVNVSKLQRMTDFLNRGLSLTGDDVLLYGVWNGCVNQTARALFTSGVLNVNTLLPITAPVLLNAELVLRNYGMMFSYYMKPYK